MFRRFNKDADRRATIGVLAMAPPFFGPWRSEWKPLRIRGHFDGGARDTPGIGKVIGAGWTLEASHRSLHGVPEWIVVHESSVKLGIGGDSFLAEACACLFLFAAMLEFAATNTVYLSPFGSICTRTSLAFPIVCAIDDALASKHVRVRFAFAKLCK